MKKLFKNLTIISSIALIGCSLVACAKQSSVTREIENSDNLMGGTVLKVPNGGTGATTFTAGECLYGNGEGAIYSDSCAAGSMTALPEGNIYVGNASNTATATSSVTVSATGVLSASGGNSTDWTTAFGWGNHAGVYDVLGQATSTLASHTTTYNHANYDTAYSWGNHAGLYDVLGQATSTKDWLLAQSNTWTGALNIFNQASTTMLTSSGNIWANGFIGNLTGTASGNLVSGGTLTSGYYCRYDGTGIDCDRVGDATGACAANAVCIGGHTHPGVNETYSSGWNSDTDTPEKDDIYDYLHLIDTNDDGDVDNIDATLKANWDTAYSWGNHAGLYDILGQATSTLSSHTTTYNHANYDTAYGWGNHAGLYDILGQATSTLASHTTAFNHSAFYNSYDDIPSASPSNGDTTHFPTADQVYDFVASNPFSYLTSVASDSDWTQHNSYPTGCTNQFVRSIGDTLTCETVDISADTNLAAGRSLTMSGDSVEADAELYTGGFTFVIASSSIATTTAVLSTKMPVAGTITQVSGYCNTGTTTIQIDERSASTPKTAGTDIMTSALAIGDYSSTTSFSNATIAAGAYINLDVDGFLVGTPARCYIDVKYTKDD